MTIITPMMKMVRCRVRCFLNEEPTFVHVAGKFYDEVEIEDMEFDEKTQAYYFPCPCGDRFVVRCLAAAV